jgi:periplasmic copper chaperone A
MSFTKYAALIAAAAAIALALLSPAVQAHGYKVGDLEISHPWSRTTPPSARVAGGYLTITNKGQVADRLVSATFEGSSSVEVHEMAHEAGVMKMRELPRGLEIKPGETLELRPGGFHLMFMNLRDALKENDTLKGVLVFEKAGRVEVAFKVEAIGYRPKEGASHSDHDHSGHGAKTQ